MMTRRDFLRTTTRASALAAGLPLGCVQTNHSPGIIDTHTHFYDPTRPQGVPWPPKDDSVLYRRVLPRDFRALAEPLGITGTVVVEASPWEEDNQWILDLAAQDPFLLGLVGHLKPGRPEFRDNSSASPPTDDSAASEPADGMAACPSTTPTGSGTWPSSQTAI